MSPESELLTLNMNYYNSFFELRYCIYSKKNETAGAPRRNQTYQKEIAENLHVVNIEWFMNHDAYEIHKCIMKCYVIIVRGNIQVEASFNFPLGRI